MTISIAWIRTIGSTQELMFAADSRYRSFGSWDCAPKLFELRGTGGVIGLSGDTEVALAIVSQLQNSINLYAPFGDGAVDITHVIGHFLRLMNNMGHEIADKKGFTDYFSGVGTKAGFVIGGYSHQYQSYKLAHILYRKSVGRFVKRPPIRRYKSAGGNFHYVRSAAAERIRRPVDSTSVCVVGDYIDTFLERLSDKALSNETLGMEPLETLIEMLNSGKYEKIGGAPQVVKAYKHLNTLPMAILWKKPNYVEQTQEAEKSVFVFGRPLMHYERTIWPILNPNDLSHPIYPLAAIKPIFR